jgi:pSer/pThr/pTyr-binding forkhead associated (FHA) protein
VPGRLFAINHSGGVSIPLSRREMVIGRAEGCDVCIHDMAVSSRHCLLKFVDSAWVVVDLHSKNGIAVNDTPITERPLRSGDTLVIARRHRYRIEYNPAAEKERFGADDDAAIDVLHHRTAKPTNEPPTVRLRREDIDQGG